MKVSTTIMFLVCGACGGGGDGDTADAPSAADAPSGTPDATLQVAVCDPGAGPFSLAIDNEFFPLPVGHRLVFDGMDGPTAVHLEITVLDMTEVVAGVTTRVVEERESEDDEIIEISRNFFVQADDGTVCYYGEDVDIYEGGVIVSHDGAWRAGNGNRPGIIMPATPAVGTSYPQEVAPGVAEDMAEIVALGEPLDVTAGAFTDTLRTREWTPLEPGTSTKWYASGIGLAVDSIVTLTSYE